MAARQHGVVTRRQLLDAGVTSRQVETRLECGRLLRLHHGVYAVGHRQLRREGRWLAAVLAVRGGVLSHREAAALHGIRDVDRRTVDVTTAASVRRTSATGLIVHRVRRLDAQDVTTRHGIPVTTVVRTLVDLADLLTEAQIRTRLRDVDRLGRLDAPALRAALARTNGRAGDGRRALRAALAERERLAISLTRSELEDRFLALLDAEQLSRPLTNHGVQGMEVDAAWPAERLVVELDSWAFHHDREAFQDDRTRSVRLARAGWVVVRFTHADVAHRPGWVAETVRELLAGGAAAPASAVPDRTHPAPSPVRATMSDPCR